MKNGSSAEHVLIRRYLLGELGDDERDRFEERFIIDRDFKERVLMAEDALIEAYINGALAEEDQRRFRAHLLSTPQQVQKLQIAQAVNRYFSVDAAAHSPPEPTPHLLRRLMSRLWPERRPLAYAAAGLLALCVVVVGWLAFPQFRNREHGAGDFAREFERLNSRGGSGVAPSLTVVLPPVSLRGGEGLPRVTPPVQAEAVELLLVLPTADEYQSYKVVLHNLDRSGRFSVSDLKAVTTSGGSRAVSVKLPAPLTPPGDYQLELGGLNAAGNVEPLADYSLTVTN